MTLYSGNHSLFTNGSDEMVYSGLEEGQVISFSDVLARGIQLEENSKYYVKGVRLSGRDNDTVSASAFTVRHDAMYVVAYGIKGEVTTYTVNYLDEEGRALAESQTFTGNVGDKPVVAFQYIEGYEPQAYNLTKTLSANAAENVFDFTYRQAPVPVAPAPTPAPGGNAGEEGQTGTGEGEGESEGAGEETGQETGEEGENAGGAGEENGELPGELETIDENGVPFEGPQDLIDLDDNETPLASLPQAFLQSIFDSDAVEFSPAAVAWTFGLTGGAIVLVVFLILWRRRKKSERA